MTFQLGHTIWLGRHHTEEAKKKISETKKGQSPCWLKGKHHTEKSKKKMSTIVKREYKDGTRPRLIGEESPSWGRHHSKETRRKLSKAQQRRKKRMGYMNSPKARIKIAKANKGKLKGEKNPFWEGGKSFELYTAQFNKELKELIRLRDGYKCQKCGCSEVENNRNLAIHHIDYDKKNCLPSNLVSLCLRCNSVVNFNRGYWTVFFQARSKKTTSSELKIKEEKLV